MEKKSKSNPLNFFYNKKIVITGINGFKGFWLCLLLQNLGAKVTGIGLKNSNFPILDKINFEKKIFKNLDINNFKKLKSYIASKNPDVIFHLASESLVYKCNLEPLKAFQTNVIGLTNLFIIIRDMKHKKNLSFNIVTSDKCYLPKNKKSYVENDELGGNDIYSSTKAVQEVLANSFYKSYFQNKKNIYITTLRAGNVIGGGDYSANRLFPDIYKSLLKNKKILIRNKNSTRPWQHVLDTLNGYLLAASYAYKNKINFSNWNFSPNSTSYKVNDIIKILIREKIINKKKVKYKKNIIKETKFLNLNPKKANNLLKWKSFYNLKKSIKDTFVVYDVLNSRINKKEKLNILKEKVKYFLKLAYGNSHRGK